ncbi:DMT family transporter [Paracoccus pacificus]|uniref:DMT family transporter n=1 Tax=Paracoccus pacificus TaxID=1463598 RepID=A0ABW4RDD3_9RHOB
MNNLRAAGLMVLSMALFAFEDTFLKLLSASLPVGQVLAMAGGLGMLVFWALMALRGQRLWTRGLLHPLVIIRNLGEAVCAMAFILAIALGDLSSASAILQSLPLMMTVGAALFLGEPVGWRRWASIAAGFVGVVMIVRPGAASFDVASLLAVVAVLGLTLRDLVTRRIPPQVSSDALTASAFGTMMLAGIALAVLRAEPPEIPAPLDLLRLCASVVFGLGGYSAMVASVRLAPLGAIAPFRYSRLVFAMLLGIIVFGERPDALTWLGSAIIVISGIYAMWREARVAGARVAASAGPPRAGGAWSRLRRR